MMPQRRVYLDWLRGLAVLIMIETHVLDSWTRADARESWPFAWAMITGGFGAPLFLFLAGISVALSSGSKLRRGLPARAASRVVMRRGLWVFALAFLFRIQAWILGWSEPRALLKVDILNIMGPSIVAAAALWGSFSTPRVRAAAFAAATLAIALITPLVQGLPILSALPDALEAYVRPVQGLSNFCLVPWAGFLFAGALAGVLIDGARTRETETRLNAALFGYGAAVAVSAYLASFLPSPYAQSRFWGNSPAFFLMRTGIITSAVGIAYAWTARRLDTTEHSIGRRHADGLGASDSTVPSRLRDRAGRWSPLEQLGRTSLFIYWIHVEMVYGLISLSLHRALRFGTALGAFVAFSLFMLACSIGKERVSEAWRAKRLSTPQGKSLHLMSLRVALGLRQKTPDGALSLKP
jgi:uncharacterized membrane protein